VSAEAVAAIVVAGGSGERFGRVDGKQLALVAGRPALSWSLLALDAAGIGTMAVVCHPDRLDEYRDGAVGSIELQARVVFARGGATRQESVAAGLAALPSGTDVIVVHDGARPCVRVETVTGALGTLRNNAGVDGVVVAHPSVDTLKTVQDGRIVDTVDRSLIWAVQTPQVFRAAILREAHDSARLQGCTATDDSALVERLGGTVVVFEGPRDNIKITLPEDLAFAEAVLRRRLEEEG